MRRTIALALCCAAGCSGGNALPTGPSPVAASIEFHAVVSASKSSAGEPACAGDLRVLPSWWGFAEVRLYPIQEQRWAILFENVPIGRHRVTLKVPEGCGGLELFANGTRLAGRGPLPEFDFTLHTDGSVGD